MAELVYLIQGGSGKQRLSQRGDARRVRGWDGCSILLSGQSSLGQRLNEEGEVQSGGLSVRVLMIPTDDTNRLDGEDYKHVKAALDNYGWSGPVFVKALKDVIENPQPARDRLEELDKLPMTQGTDNLQRRRAARMVGYVWLAGEYARDAGLIPTDASLEKLARQVWKDALSSDVAPDNPAEKAVDNLLEWIVANRGGAIHEFRPDAGEIQKYDIEAKDANEGNQEAKGWFGVPVTGVDKEGAKNGRGKGLCRSFQPQFHLQSAARRLATLISSRLSKPAT